MDEEALEEGKTGEKKRTQRRLGPMLTTKDQIGGQKPLYTSPREQKGEKDRPYDLGRGWAPRGEKPRIG